MEGLRQFNLFKLKIFFFVVVAFVVCVNSDLMKSLITSEKNTIFKFYNDLINYYKMEDRVEIRREEDNLKLIAKQNYEKSMPIVGIESKFYFTSCDFFPFSEFILKAFSDYAEQTGENLESFSSFVLTFNMLYFKIGDRIKAAKYYQDKINLDILNSTSYVKFGTDNEVQRYLFSLPNHSFKSSLKYSDEEAQIAEKLKLELGYRNKVREVFLYVNQWVANNTNDDIKTAMGTFISNEEEFYSFVGLVSSKRYAISEEGYLNTFYAEQKNEYNEIQTHVLPEGYSRKSCQIFSPFLDLIPYKNADAKQDIRTLKTEIQFGNLGNNFIGISFNAPTKKGEEIEIYHKELLSNEFIFITSGDISDGKSDNIGFHLKLNKSELLEDQIMFCHRVGCNGLNILQLWKNSQVETIYFPFKLTRNDFNNKILPIMRLFNVRKPPESLIPYIQANAPFNYNVEAKTLSTYLNILINFVNNFDSGKILKDYSQLNGKNEQQKIKLIKTNYGVEVTNPLEFDFEVVRTMFKITVDKIKLVNSHILDTLDKLRKNSLDDIKKILKIK